jgi:hypothetical protein
VYERLSSQRFFRSARLAACRGGPAAALARMRLCKQNHSRKTKARLIRRRFSVYKAETGGVSAEDDRP